MGVNDVPITDDIAIEGNSLYKLSDEESGSDNAYKTTDSASTTINDTDYIPISDANGNRKKSLWSTIVDKIKNALGIESSGSTYLKKDGTWGAAIDTTKVPLITHTGIGEIYGGGSYQWGKIAIITVVSTYIDGPVVFEVSQRNYALSIIQVSFKSVNSIDPNLDYFITDNDNHYYIKKVATSTWELYAKYSESYGGVALHRVTGYRANNYVDVVIVMENISEPTGITQVSYGGNVSYANSAGSAIDAVNASYAASAGSANNATKATLALKLGSGGSDAYPMQFNWTGQSGQPTWVWGGNEYANIYVYNPSNFSVSKAANATTYQEIFNGYCSAANSWQTKALASNYKFSTYKFLIFETRQYGNATQVYIEAVDRFKGHSSTGNRIIMTATTGEQYQIYYVDDTRIGLAQSQVNGTYLTLHIYGMISV